jgi:radical SAM superfamily enzyme YgiQ (UPF0313 family)
MQAERPDVVGFSLIFQYMVPQFAAVIRALRAAGVQAHFTIGGHYASFEPAELLRHIPELDSVVRFEGEDTLSEIVERFDHPSLWRTIPGIAWLDHGKTVLNLPRQGRTHVDDFPEPDRRDIDYRRQELPTASVLASRGCPWKCSFCSIITFYEANGTTGRRRRNPTKVVDEVEHLVRGRGARLILFQDDDFLAGGTEAKAWAKAVACDIVRRGLEQEMRWKIACRSDEIRADLLAPLAAAGLCHVYMGVESGDETSLVSLNKHLKPDVHLRAGAILRELDISFDFGSLVHAANGAQQHGIPSNLHRRRLGRGRILPDLAIRGDAHRKAVAGRRPAQRIVAGGRISVPRFTRRPAVGFLLDGIRRTEFWTECDMERSARIVVRYPSRYAGTPP